MASKKSKGNSKASSKKSNAGKYKKELEEIRKMRDINAIMKTADIESALLNAPSSETESLMGTRIEKRLEELSEQKTKDSSLDDLERMTTGGSQRSSSNTKRSAPKKSMPKHKTQGKKSKKARRR